MAEAPNPRPSDTPIAPIYNDISPTVVWLLRITGAATAVMVALAFIFCLVQGARENHTFYLLACNTIISALVGLVHLFWYRKGDLPADKYWYMLVVAGVIIFQSLSTDIFVFNFHRIENVDNSTSHTTTTAKSF